MELSKQHRHILLHSLGWRDGQPPRPYRNHYVAGGADLKLCRELAEAGLMREHKAGFDWLTAGTPLFSVSDAGRKYLEETREPPKKLTRSQKRYQRYLESEWFAGTFGEWLKHRG